MRFQTTTTQLNTGPTLPPPNLTNNLLSFVDSTGQVWVSRNSVNGGNWARARDVLHATWGRAAAWNMPVANTWTTFPMDTLIWDPYVIFDSVHGLFTPAVAGVYRIYFTIGVNVTAAGQTVQSGIWLGTTSTLASGQSQASVSSPGLTAACEYTLQVTVGQPYAIRIVGNTSALVGRNNQDTTRVQVDYLGTG